LCGNKIKIIEAKSKTKRLQCRRWLLHFTFGREMVDALNLFLYFAAAASNYIWRCQIFKMVMLLAHAIFYESTSR